MGHKQMDGNRGFSALVCTALALGIPAAAAGAAPADRPLTAALRSQTIERLLRSLDEQYVFPEKAAEAHRIIGERAKRGAYDALGTGPALARALKEQVNEILHDGHFHVHYQAEKIPPSDPSAKPTREELARSNAEAKWVNGGFEKVERLPGNIGYLEVRSLEFPRLGAEAAAAAMSFVANTDALIIDLRRNHGGEPDLVATICSYFFAEPVHLNDIRSRESTRQYWSFASVPGSRYLDRDIYVLTSKETGSGAEELAYDLQQLKRATIVGEVTWGGANPGDMVRLNDHFSAFISTAEAINPISKTNWEGVGVKPDIATPAADALRIAQVKILSKLLAVSKDAEHKQRLQNRLRELTTN
jgi:C-terminal processing protease CtpA/Prc